MHDASRGGAHCRRSVRRRGHSDPRRWSSRSARPPTASPDSCTVSPVLDSNTAAEEPRPPALKRRHRALGALGRQQHWPRSQIKALVADPLYSRKQKEYYPHSLTHSLLRITRSFVKFRFITILILHGRSRDNNGPDARIKMCRGIRDIDRS